MRCTFCATGQGGFARNLRAHEILDQVLTVQEAFARRVSNVVFMGEGQSLQLLTWSSLI
jgi:23S rRNA (adenine2503-C2)-methyltransferase